MPAFLDGARLPDLQAAWRAHFSAVATPDAAPAATPVAAPAAQTDNTVMQTSREAISAELTNTYLASRHVPFALQVPPMAVPAAAHTFP